MKLLSIAIPCYNSEAYMRHCIESLLPGGDEVEILIVDDGSTKDRTAEIADEYERKYPGICRAIHQENGGHGEAVNTGLRNAEGIYYKVVDSDDWVDEAAYQEILSTLRRFVCGEETLDMLISNFVYEKQGAKRKKVMNYRTALPQNELFTWDDVKVFMLGQYILMHSVIYRTELLRECGLELPKHTFYVDNIFVYQPLPHVKTMYYLNVKFLPVFYRKRRPVGERGGHDRPNRPADPRDEADAWLLRRHEAEETQAPPLHGALSRDYDDGFFHTGDQVRDRGEHGEEEGAVAVSAQAESHAVSPAEMGIPGTGNEPSGQERP